MGNRTLFKVCGMTRLEDAIAAAEAGASYLGFIFYPKSPRCMDLERFRAIKRDLPDLRRVAVLVDPEPTDLRQYLDEGFDRVQIHFSTKVAIERIAEWSRIVGKENLWLAAKLAPGESFDDRLLEYADTFLWDAYKKDSYGGTGHTSDWGQFRSMMETHSTRQWVLAGGLAPSNLLDALAASGANFVDLNSGVEISPGIKDPVKLKAVKRLMER